MHKAIQPKVTLVGAGPGDPDLLTLKAVKALAQADVVLYDALANEEILEHAPKSAIKIYVGKRCSNHTFTQDEINQLIVDNALTYGHVVRLKGGDPFIFGRGSEETEFAETFGIPTTVIPGISSAIAVPANAGISITKRGVSESFWVITATTSEKKLSDDIALAAQSSATVVILMGMHKLAQITEVFRKQNKGDLPVAIIQNGTTSQEKIGVGTVNSIEGVVAKLKLGAPAIIVLGEVVKETNKLRHYFEAYLSKDAGK